MAQTVVCPRHLTIDDCLLRSGVAKRRIKKVRVMRVMQSNQDGLWFHL
jgi:hypothetical protein